MAARTTKTDEQKASEAQAAEDQKAADEQKTADQAAADAQADADVAKANAAQAAADADAAQAEASAKPTIPAVEHSAPAVEGADEIAEKASPKDVTEEDGVAAFRPPQTKHTPWTINTLAESEGGSALGVEQTSGNADVTKDPADRTDGAQ